MPALADLGGVVPIWQKPGPRAGKQKPTGATHTCGSPTGTNAPGLTYLLSGSALSPTNSAVKHTPLNAERVQFTCQPRLHPRRSLPSRIDLPDESR